jgi:hypothetical protein
MAADDLVERRFYQTNCDEYPIWIAFGAFSRQLIHRANATSVHIFALPLHNWLTAE